MNSIDFVEVDKLVPVLTDFFGEVASKMGIETQFNLGASGILVRAEPALLRQAILAVISNAVDAMEESPVKILEISTRVEGKTLLVSIADTGVGIPAAIRDKIYDPFFTTKDPNRGTGLGLTMAYRTLQDCGGQITFAEKKSGGTEFILSIPTAQKPAGDSDTPDWPLVES